VGLAREEARMIQRWKTRVGWLMLVWGRRGCLLLAGGAVLACAVSGTEALFAYVFSRLLFRLGYEKFAVSVPTGLSAVALSPAAAIMVLVVLGLVRSAVRIMASQWHAYSQERMLARLRFVFFGRLLDTDTPRFSQTEVNTYFSELFPKATGFSTSLATCTNTGARAFLFLALLLYTSPVKATVGCGAILLLAPLLRWMNLRSQALAAGTVRDFKWVQRSIVRASRNWLLVRIYRTEADELRQLQETSLATTNKALRVMLMTGTAGNIPEAAGVLVISAMLWVQFYVDPQPGNMLLVFLFMYMRLVQTLSQLSATICQMYSCMPHFDVAGAFLEAVPRDQARKSFEPVFHLSLLGSLATPKSLRRTPANRPPVQADSQADPPDIRVEGLSFSYPDDAKPVFHGLSVSVPAGGDLGIVGRSGAGKSTLLALLLGFLQPSQGGLWVGGKTAKDQRLSGNLRTGYVGPEPFMVAGSLRDNLLYGASCSPPEDDLLSALQEAGFLEERATLRKMLGLRISEDGEGLSTGQKQRLGLARALLMRPQLLVLDEVSANLDIETEAHIAKTVTGLAGRTTVIIVSHRKGMLAHCSRILNLDAVEVQ